MASRRDKYSMLKDEGKLHGTIARARKLRTARDRLFTNACLREITPPQNRIIIPLGCILSNTVAQDARLAQPRLRRWERPTPNADIRSKQYYVAIVYCGRYSSRCKYAKVDYEPRIRSFAIISPKRMCWFIASRHEVWVAPRGWHFGTDCRPGTTWSRLYVCRDRYADDVDRRWRFNTDDIFRGEKVFWRDARQFDNSVLQQRRDKKEYARVTSTVITVDLIVPHNGVRTVLRIQRTGPMSYNGIPLYHRRRE